jgi:hypothetical protein
MTQLVREPSVITTFRCLPATGSGGLLSEVPAGPYVFVWLPAVTAIDKLNFKTGN